MKAYSLLYLSLFSFVTISACKPSRTAQTEKMKEMEKKELKMLENSQAKSEEEALEISFGPSHEGLVNWVLSDTATFPTLSPEVSKRNTSPSPLQPTNACASIHGVEKDNTFLFSKGSYRYVVTMSDKATLKVQHNGKTILQQTQETKEF